MPACSMCPSSALAASDRYEAESTPRRPARILFAGGAAEAPASRASNELRASATPHRDAEGRFTDSVVRDAYQTLINSPLETCRSNARTLALLADSPISLEDLRLRVAALIPSPMPGQPPVYGAQAERRAAVFSAKSWRCFFNGVCFADCNSHS